MWWGGGGHRSNGLSAKGGLGGVEEATSMSDSEAAVGGSNQITQRDP
jgi:hypothetical protein